MRNPPYLPSKIAELLPWAANFSTLLTASPSTYGLTTGDGNAVQTAVTNWVTAQNTALAPSTRTPAAVAQAAALRADMEAIIRPLAVLISGNSAVTAEDKSAIGVTLRSSVRTPVVAPTVAPTLALVGASVGTVTVRYANAETPNSKAAPNGCGGVELTVAFGDAAAASPSEGSVLASLTRSPGTLQVAGHTGQTATIWARWRTKNGVQGGQVGYSPYSAPIVVVIN